MHLDMRRRALAALLSMTLGAAACGGQSTAGGLIEQIDSEAKPAEVDGGGELPEPGCTSLQAVRWGPAEVVPPAGVRFDFSLADCAGAPIAGLASVGAVRVDEDESGLPLGPPGTPTPVLSIARDFAFRSVVVLDLSNSVVASGRLDAVLDGALALVETLVDEVDDPRLRHELALYVFGSTAESVVWQPFSHDAALLRARIEALRGDPGRGSSNLYGAVSTALDLLDAAGQGDPRAVGSLVLVTDGLHETGDLQAQRAAVLERLGASATEVHVLAFVDGYDPEQLSELASAPAFFATLGDGDGAAFADTAERMATRRASFYSVAVCSPVEGPGRSLTVHVTVGAASASFQVSYDATGFNLAGCEPAIVGDPCQGRTCGAHDGWVCGTCAASETCSDGACCEAACSEARVCGDDGCGGSCGACPAGQVCVQESGGAHCAETICEPGAAACEGASVVVCDLGGVAWTPKEDCAAEGQVCVAGSCQPPVCEAGALVCQDDGLYQCDAAGTSLSLVEACVAQGPCWEVSCSVEAGCVQAPVMGASCDDGEACTVGDVCDAAGGCAGQAMDCEGFETACATAACVDGACAVTITADAPCDDGDPCTAVSTCDAQGACQGPVDAMLPGCLCDSDAACDDGLPCTVDTCHADGTCGHVVAPGTCLVGGACVGAGQTAPSNLCAVCDPAANPNAWTPVVCADSDPCTSDACLPQGGCVHVPNATAPCDDGDACTVDDACDGQGACVGAPMDCSSLAGPCVVASCSAGQCKAQVTPGAACDDGDACTPSSTCDGAGSCVGTSDPAIPGCPCVLDVQCSDGLGCTEDTCGADGTCRSEVKAGHCLIGGVCFTVGSKSPTSVCSTCAPQVDPEGWTEVTCDDGNPCTDDLCKAQSGCEFVPDDGNPCSDGLACSDDDHCEAGVCVGTCGECSKDADCKGPAPACMKLACVDHDCVAVPDAGADGAACEDGAWCTVGDVCAAGQCVAGAPRSCPADGACLEGSCDEQTDACVTTPVAPGTACDDGASCTDQDVCDLAGVCVGVPGSACTCTTAADCDDGLFCNGVEVCGPTGVCKQGHPPHDDGIGCTIDTCDEATKTVKHALDHAACDDGVFCNGVEKCTLGGCATELLELSDGVACTDDICNEALKKIEHVSNCDDGLFCNGLETCDLATGACVPGSVALDDGLACTIDSCDEVLDLVLHDPGDPNPEPCAAVAGVCGGPSCQQARQLGCLLDDGATVEARGSVGADVSVSHWYRFDAIDWPDVTGCDEFHVQIALSVNPGGQYAFEVHRGGCAAQDKVCGGATQFDERTDFYSEGGDGKFGECPCAFGEAATTSGVQRCSDNGTTYFVRVYRTGSPPAAGEYTLRVSNGAP